MASLLVEKISNRFFYGWVIVGVCFLSWLVADAFGFYTFGLYIVPINKELGWSFMTITGAMTLRMLTAGCLGPVIGFITDKKYGARILMSCGILAAGTTTFSISFVQEPWQFYLLYGVVGALGMVGFGGLVTHTIIAKWFIRMRGRAMGIATLGVSMSGLMFIPITHYMIENFGWRYSLRLVGIIVLCIAFLPTVVFMRRRPEDIGLLPDGDKPTSSAKLNKNFIETGLEMNRQSWTLGEALKSKTLWILLAAFNVTGLSLNGITIHFYPYMEEKGIGSIVAASSMTLFAFCCAVVKIPWGLVAEKVSARTCVIIIFFGSALGLLILIFSNNVAAVFAYSVVYGMALGGMMVIREVLYADYFGHEFLGTIRGVVMPINVIFMAGSPILAAWLYEAFGSYNIPFSVFVFNFIIGSILIFFAKPPRNT